ncbi:MAG: 3-hydroxyacyl-CoA dehydrogenase family protein [Acidimicrobiia bacterium]
MTTPYRTIAILGGGGLMGHGIALACLQGSDADVVIVSRRSESVEHGLGLVESGPFGLSRGVAKGRISEEKAGAARARLRGTTDYEEGLANADLVFETVPEVVATKHTVLAAAARHAPDDAVFATNTSSILISELGAAMPDPARLVGTHWFYPANVMPLVEVARSGVVDEEILGSVTTFLEHIGKKPVIVRDSPGFFMTRFVNNYLAEAIRLVELGVAGPAEIDEMCKTGLGWPMGVFEFLDDTASFDSFYHAQEYLHETCGERYAIPPLARQVFSAGYLGSSRLKPQSKGGWFDFLGVPRGESG